MAAPDSLQPLLRPRAVAVVGASRDPASVGRRILDALVRAGFNGPVYPINPKAEHIGSIRAYPRVSEIRDQVDLAVVAVPASAVHEVVDDCGRAGVRGLVVISAGFAEIGSEGRDLQDRLLERVRRYGMRMVGPNCLGLLQTDPEIRLNASFAPHIPEPGAVGLCSQSGALGIAVIALARRIGLGLSSFVSIGNKADLSGNDLLEYWRDDAATEVILFYLESFGDPRRFARIARDLGRQKPIVVVKAGRTASGSRAAGSHTAALSAPETAVDALFAQNGILRADTLQEMFGLARGLAMQPLPQGRRVAIVSNAGGPAILCADSLESSGLTVEPLTAATQEALARGLPAAASCVNPVDMIAFAGPDAYRESVERLLTADEVDALIVIYTPTGVVPTRDIGRAIAEGVDASRSNGANRKPVLASVVGEDEEIHRLETPAGEVIPVFQFPEEIGRVVGKVARYADWRRSDPGTFPELPDQDLEACEAICRQAVEDRGDGWLGADETRRVLSAAGLQVAPGGVAANAEQAASIAASIGFPVAVKLASHEIVHKTEIGGVRLDLVDERAVREAWDAIAGRLRDEGRDEAMEGVLVQPMLAGTAEVMIGMEQDPLFGPLVAFGLGGIHVEILRDVAFRVAPLTDRDAREMVRAIRGFRLLEGYRGHPAADVPALEEALLRVARLTDCVPRIAELDLNPIFALEPGSGYHIADARIRVRNNESKSQAGGSDSIT